VLSAFADDVRHTTAVQAVRRNNLVAALADALLVPYASPNGKTWTAVHAALKRKQPVFTFDGKDNADLLKAGAQPFELLLEKENSPQTRNDQHTVPQGG
jgi:predicted Rossmann fold nucleotide-binding protein DprA/Smf involved in DNA uptake